MACVLIVTNAMTIETIAAIANTHQLMLVR
jgi:hypothetical protein